MIRRALLARGEVQGVGFRPQVLRLAHRHGLTGFVRNDPDGVRIEVQGAADAVRALEAGVRALRPPVRLRSLDASERDPVDEVGFHIAPSAHAGQRAHTLPPDLVLCAACAAEVRDPADRRFDHPFTSCTDCGPRATIAGPPPFDRGRSAMGAFELCARCAEEYSDPSDRRFHAQTIACPDCGPRLDGSLDGAAAILREGGVVALKGVGGFQLLCDATSAPAVARLRQLKRRPDKPLAVMALEPSALVGELSAAAERALRGPAGPIVVLPWDGRGLAAGVAVGELGLMLPTTPLHLRLLDRLKRPVVCTSGNPSGAPLATERATAEADLGPGVRAWLDHDRAIERPMDDSVVRPVGDQLVVMRRARGLCPRPLQLATVGPTVLALGAFLQAAPALLPRDLAYVAPHVGDLDERRTLARYRQEVDRLLDDHGAPAAVACDLHPDLPSTRLAEALSARHGVPLIRVQHHHAHIAAVLAEHHAPADALGLAWDGVGHGRDGTSWGGEALRDGARLAHLARIALPGGDKASVQPARVALALLHGAGRLEGHTSAARACLGDAVTDGVIELLGAGIAPRTSAIGRLFDGIAFLLGGPGVITYEAQAALWLERLARRGGGPALPLPLIDGALDWRVLVTALLDGLSTGCDRADLARGFHAALVQAAAELAREHATEAIALGGGCFQNALLLAGCRATLEDAGHSVLTARDLPPGDGGLALGQAAIARQQLSSG